ncbi:MAG: hypothetical protein ABFR89_01110 [Actinomycetota bacterium]
MSARDPLQRLSSAYRLAVSDETMHRHLAEVATAIRSAPSAPLPAGFGLRRRIAAMAAALVVFAPSAMAVAADDAVPGEMLYPVKQAAERLMGLFDSKIEATHRIEEVEQLVQRRVHRSEVTHAVQRAESATAKLTEPAELELRLVRAQELHKQQIEQEISEQSRSDGKQTAPDPGPGEAGSGEGTGVTTTPGSDGSTGHTPTTHGGDGTGQNDTGAEGSGSGSPATSEPPKGSDGSK